MNAGRGATTPVRRRLGLAAAAATLALALLAPAQALAGAPVETSPPYLEFYGPLQPGTHVHLNVGTWSGALGVNLLFEKCLPDSVPIPPTGDYSGDGCKALYSNGYPDYTLQAGDVGHRIIALVDAYDSTGFYGTTDATEKSDYVTAADENDPQGTDLDSDPGEDALSWSQSSTDPDTLVDANPDDYTNPNAFLEATSGYTAAELAASTHHAYDIYKFYSGAGSGVTYVLRYGIYHPQSGKGFGLRKINGKHGWGSVMDSRIAETVYSPRNRSFQGTSTIFYRHVKPNKKCLFKVVYQNAIVGDNRPKGIITAYPVRHTGC